MSGGNSTHKGEVRSTRLNPQTDRKYEKYRDENELNDSEAVRRLIRRAIESEEEDTLDKLEVDDELRDRVEAAREDGETLDDAVRRLLRVGIASVGDENSTSRLTAAGVVLFLGGVPAALATAGNTEAAFAIVLTLVLWVLFGGAVSSGMEYFRSRTGF